MDESMTCEEFVAALRKELEVLCVDWKETQAADPEECPEKMTIAEWWSHLSTRFPA
jgi:hypothetical protein